MKTGITSPAQETDPDPSESPTAHFSPLSDLEFKIARIQAESVVLRIVPKTVEPRAILRHSQNRIYLRSQVTFAEAQQAEGGAGCAHQRSSETRDTALTEFLRALGRCFTHADGYK